MTKAQILARKGEVSAAAELVQSLVDRAGSYQHNEVFAEGADLLDAYGSRDSAVATLDRVGHRSTQTTADRRLVAVTEAKLFLRQGRFDEAAAALANYPPGVSTVVGQRASFEMTTAYLKVSRGDKGAGRAAALATEAAASQGAHAMRRVGDLLSGAIAGPEELGDAIIAIGPSYPWHLTYLADILTSRIATLSDDARAVIGRAAALHPERWRRELRSRLASDAGATDLPAARLLEEIGDRTDIARLRRWAKAGRRTREATVLGRSLARRLASAVYVEDQGRVTISVGDREVLGSTVRRKVLALLCFLLTKPELSATRDQVLDSLWPELDPEVAINSLNQTLYFLRRVFEESYSEDLSPGYVHHDSDVLWLDPELVSSRSVECRRLVRESAASAESGRSRAVELDCIAADSPSTLSTRSGPAAYRDSLHAAYLEIVERSVLDDFAAGHYDRGIRIARRALEVDATAEQIEISLLRLYRASGAHAAAAEQYAHYAAVMREELGMEPPPLEFPVGIGKVPY